MSKFKRNLNFKNYSVSGFGQVFNHIFQFADSTIERPGHLRNKFKTFKLAASWRSSTYLLIVNRNRSASSYEHQTDQNFGGHLPTSSVDYWTLDDPAAGI